jgi:hypothetical protein
MKLSLFYQTKQISSYIPLLDAAEISSALQKSPLPTFGPTVLRHLKVGPIQPLWNTMIAEAANYYYGNWPTIGDSHHYRLIGQAMMREYPLIGMDGQNKWVSKEIESTHACTFYFVTNLIY